MDWLGLSVRMLPELLLLALLLALLEILMLVVLLGKLRTGKIIVQTKEKVLEVCSQDGNLPEAVLLNVVLALVLLR